MSVEGGVFRDGVRFHCRIRRRQLHRTHSTVRGGDDVSDAN